MKVWELVSKMIGGTVIIIMKEGVQVVSVGSEYWGAIDNSILNLAVKRCAVSAKLMSRPSIKIWATEGESTEVETQAELQAAMDDDTISDITLSADITGDGSESYVAMLTSGEKSLDLNGHRIMLQNGSKEDELYALKAFGEGTVLNIYDSAGGGLVDGNDKAGFNCCIVQGEGAEVNVYGGKYTVGNQAEGASTTIYAQLGTINLYDGTFINRDWDDSEKAQGNNVVLNITNNSGSYINCFGGEYYGQNPADGDDKDSTTGATFLPSGCEVKTSTSGTDTIYTVVKDE